MRRDDNVTRMSLVRCLVAVMLAAVGCSSSPLDTPSVSPPPIVEPLGPTSAPAQRYDTIEEMRDVLGMGEEVASGVGNNEETLKDFVALKGPEGLVDIYLFENRKQRNAWLPQMKGSLQVIYGPNWIVVPFANARTVLAVLGGTVTAPPASPDH